MASLKQKLKAMAITLSIVIPSGKASAIETYQHDNPSSQTEVVSNKPTSEYDSRTFNLNDSIVNVRNKIYERNAAAYKGPNPLASNVKYMGFDDTDIWNGEQHWYQITNKYGTIKYPSGKKTIEEQLKNESRTAAAPLLSPKMEAHIKSFYKGDNNDHKRDYYIQGYYICNALKVHIEQNKGSTPPEDHNQQQKQLDKDLTVIQQELKTLGITVNPKTGELNKGTQQNPSSPTQYHVRGETK